MRILWWRLFLTKFIFRHSTIESLLRECRRNSQLRQLCGLQSHYISMNHTNNHVCIVPSSAAMFHFIKKLKEHQEDLTEMMLILEKKVQEELPDFGKEVAVDGKIIQSYANKVSTKEPDGRRETQVDTTEKNYYSNNGTKTTKYYFGF